MAKIHPQKNLGVCLATNGRHAVRIDAPVATKSNNKLRVKALTINFPLEIQTRVVADFKNSRDIAAVGIFHRTAST